jgi:hypothetical protein
MEINWYDPDEVVPTVPPRDRACAERDGLFAPMPVDLVQVLRLGCLAGANLSDLSQEEGWRRIVPAGLGLVVMAEMAWFAQHTRTVDAYKTYGSVDKDGIEVSGELYRAHTWDESSHWFNILSLISERYKLAPASFEELRIAACVLLAKRRLGTCAQPYYIVIASCVEKRAIWLDISYQEPVVTNLAPFALFDRHRPLQGNQQVCFTCKQVCPCSKRKCGKCKITPYCSKACLKSDFQAHKKVCVVALTPGAQSLASLVHRKVSFRAPADVVFYLRAVMCPL